MKVFSATIALMLLAEGSAFSPSAQSKTSTSLNVVPGVAEAFGMTIVSGVVGKMTKQREAMYASGNMGAVGSTPSSDVSIQYNAPAVLAYASAGPSKGDFETFQATYERQCVGIVKQKQCQQLGKPVPAWATIAAAGVDISIPYDAAAKNAYKAAGSSGDYGTFKKAFEAKAAAAVAAKQ